MTRTSLIKPISFPIKPVIKGLDTSEQPSVIDMANTPDVSNMKAYKGQLATRPGFTGKYTGAYESVLRLDYLYSTAGGTLLIAASRGKLYQLIGLRFRRIPVYTGAGTGTFVASATPLNPFAIILPDNWWSVDIGKTRYDGGDINGGALWPGSSDYGDLTIICNEADGIFVVALTGSGAESERLTATTGVAPISGRGVVMMGGRVVVLAPKGVGGFTLSSYIQWSAVGRADKWDSGDGGGSILIGDEPDSIQTAVRLGEYLIVYKERSIYIGNKTFLTDPPFYFSPSQSQGIGLAAPLSVGELTEEHIFLGWDDVYSFSLKGVQSIGSSVKDDLLRGTDGIVPQYINSCVGVIVEEFDEYWLFVPTGKMPAYTDGANVVNYLSNPTTQEVEISGTTTLASLIVTAVSAGDLAKIYVGDTVIGAGIPAGNTVSVKGGAQFTMAGSNATKTTALNKLMVSGDHITAWSDLICGWGGQSGNMGVWPYHRFRALTGGNFGGRYLSIDRSLGIVDPAQQWEFIRSPVSTFLGNVTGHTISALLWIRCGGIGTLKIRILDNALVTRIERTVSINVAMSRFEPFAVHWLVNAGNGLDFTLEARFESTDRNAALDVDCGYLVDLGVAGGLRVDEGYVYQQEGTWKCLGYKGLLNQIEMIPFFIDRIGKWVSDTVWVYNYQNESWWKWRIPVGGFGYDSISDVIRIADLVGLASEQTWRFDEKLLEALAPTNLICPPDGQVYEVSKGYTTDWEGLLDRPILNYWQSKDFDLGHPELEKTLSRVIIHHEKSHPPTEVTVSASTDSGASWENQIINIRQGYTETFIDFFVTGPQIRFKVQAQGGLFINGFSIKVIGRGESNAY